MTFQPVLVEWDDQPFAPKRFVVWATEPRSVTPPNGDEFSYGPVCIDGDHIQFSEPPVGGVCTGSGKSVYSWEVVNDGLILQTIEDECVFREVFLVAQGWRKVPA
jgi:hypothetical protein